MSNLDRIFERAFQMPEGECYFPEPGRGAPPIEHRRAMSIRTIEQLLADGETNRFKNALLKMKSDGLIDDTQLQEFLELA